MVSLSLHWFIVTSTCWLHNHTNVDSMATKLQTERLGDKRWVWSVDLRGWYLKRQLWYTQLNCLLCHCQEADFLSKQATPTNDSFNQLMEEDEQQLIESGEHVSCLTLESPTDHYMVNWYLGFQFTSNKWGIQFPTSNFRFFFITQVPFVKIGSWFG